MPSFNPILQVGIHIFFLVTGVLGNLFILIVYFSDWVKTHDVNPSTLIISSIAVINIFYQGTITFNEITNLMFMEFYGQVWVVIPLVAIMCSLAFSSLWCSTCLCFYYCIKIVNFQGSFFYKLKAKVAVIVPWLLIISIAASWSFGVPAYWDLYTDIKVVTARNVTSLLSFAVRSRCKCLFQIYTMIAAIAFAIIFITAGAIVTSLCKHMIRMKKNNEGSGNSRIHSHLLAAKTVTSLLVLYLIFYGFLSSLFNEAENAGTLMFDLSFMVVSSFSTFNSITLILGNPKLSNSLKKLLCMRPHTAHTEVPVTTH
ncbi:taste receptor type 2 member 40-like [Dendropsophus ebraccatus]|uniref:taste receptor type 2 member 40-like n=1 Tax=Dendropsophus ebraccatus TaxID=150705 RepID=UPI0038318E11